MKCPNINHPDFKLLKNKFGVSLTLWLYNQNGEEIPTLAQAEELLKTTPVANELPTNENLLESRLILANPTFQKDAVDSITYLMYNGLLEEFKVESFQDINLEDIKPITLNNIILNVKKEFENIYKETEADIYRDVVDNFDALANIAFKKFSNIGYDINEELLSSETRENEAEEGKERIYSRLVLEENRKDSLSKGIKLYISFLQDPSATNNMGFPKLVNFDDTYSYLAINLTGSENLTEMILRLDELKEFRPELNQVISDLRNSDNQNFKNNFFSSLGNDYKNFISVIKLAEEYEIFNEETQKKEKREKTVYRVIDTNRQSLQRIIKSEWAEANKNSLKNKDASTIQVYKDYIIKNQKALDDLTNESVLDFVQDVLSDTGITISKKGLSYYRKSYKTKNPKESFAAHLIKFSEAGPGAIVNSFHNGNSIFNEVGESLQSETASINGLANAEQYTRVDKSVGSFINGQGKPVYSVNLNNFASDNYRRLVDNVEGVRDKYENDSFYQSSIILKGIKSNPEVYKTGIFDSITDNNRDGVDFSGFDPLTEVVSKFNLFFNNGQGKGKTNGLGWFFPPTPGDKTSPPIYQLPKIDKFNTKFFNDDVLNRDTEFYKWLIADIKAEYSRIVRESKFAFTNQDPNALIQNYHYKLNSKDPQDKSKPGNAFIFNHHPYLNELVWKKEPKSFDDVTPTDLKKIDFDSANFHIDLSRVFRESFETEKTILAEKGLINYNKENGAVELVKLELVDQGAVANFAQTLDQYIANTIVYNTELTKLNLGDLAFFKGMTDANKRSSLSYTPGTKLSVASELNPDGVRPHFTVALVTDKEVNSSHIDDYIDIIKGSKKSPSVKERLLKLFSKYTGINISDAQGYCTLDRWVEYMKGQGLYTDPVKLAVERIRKGENTFDDNSTVLQPIKGFYYGHQEIDGRVVPVNLKYSVVPLIPSLTKNHKDLNQMRLNMEAGGSDELVFISGVKTGIHNVNNYEDVIKEGSKLKNVVLDNNNWRIPQVVPYKEKGSANFGSQLRKLITSNQDNKELLAEYESLLKANIQEGIEKAKIKLDSIEKVSAILVEELLSNPNRAVSETLASALQITQTANGPDTVIPIDFPSIKNKIENIVNSILDKNIFDMSMPGASAVQMSSVGLGSELKPVRMEGDKVLPAEVNVSPQYFINVLKKKGLTETQIKAFFDAEGNFDIRKLDGELRKIVLYRIPTQGKNSMVPAVIKSFLPKDSGSLIQLPYEVLVQTGSDFDIDKLFMEMAHFNIKEDRLRKLESGTSTLEERQNRIIDIHYTVLTDPNNFLEVTTPNHSETLLELKNLIGPKFERKVKKYWFNNWVQEDFRDKNKAGKDLIGVWSIANTFTAIAQNIGLMTTTPILFNGEDVTNLSAKEDFDGNLISDQKAEFQTAAVDNAKDPILGTLNVNMFTSGFVNLFISAGSGIEFPIHFVNQPIIRELSAAFVKHSATSTKTKALKQAIKDVASETLVQYFDIVGLAATNFSTKELISGDVDQSKILQTFLYYQKLGEELSIFANSISIDTKGMKPGVAENVQNKRNLDNVTKKTGSFTYNQDLFEKHSFSAYKDGLNEAIEITSKYFIQSSSAFEDIHSEFEDKFGVTLNKDQMEDINNSLYTYIFTSKNSYFNSLSKDYLKSLLVNTDTNKNLAGRLVNYYNEQKKIKESEPSHDINMFIEYLSTKQDKDNKNITWVNFNNILSKVLTQEQKTYLTESLWNLYKDGNEVERQLAKDLFNYNFMVNGFTYSPTSYIEYIHPNFFIDNGVIDFYREVKELLQAENQDGTDHFNKSKFVDQYVRNNYEDLNFIPRIYTTDKMDKRKGLYQVLKKGSKSTLLVYNDSTGKFDAHQDKIVKQFNFDQLIDFNSRFEQKIC